jgi:DnaJ domain
MPQAHGAGAASVVTQLLAFLRDPARYRAHFTTARASLDGGHHALKFAQGKFPPGLAHDLPTHEREELQRAAVAFIREVCFWDGATHYQLLCVAPEAKREAVKENYHLMMSLIHPDHAEGASEAWPAEWAQRVNNAYAVLAEMAARESYDRSLRIPESPRAREPARAPGVRSPARRGPRASAARVRLAKTLLTVSAVAATLLLLEVWISDVPRGHFPWSGAARNRDLVAGAERPRYLGANVLATRESARDALPPAKDTQSSPKREPQWRPLVAVPAVETLPARVTPFAQPAAQILVPESEAEPQGHEAGPAALQVPAQQPHPVVAQAARSSPPAESVRLTSEEIELVVVRLIGYYEAGEADNLMGLLDVSETGLWQATRTRQAYAEFFQATRQRRLRVKSLEWQTASASAHAQGRATVQAEYLDAPGKLERDIEVEMDIALRNGQAKITRLALFPNEP